MDRRFAVLYMLYCNAHRDPEQRAEPFSLEDFLPAKKTRAESPTSAPMTREEYLLSEARKHPEPAWQIETARALSESFDQRTPINRRFQ